jgi:hypothetical protein
MVINSNNINKTNNHLSSKLNSLNNKKTMTYDVEKAGTCLGQAHKCGRINLVNGIPVLRSDIILGLNDSSFLINVLFLISSISRRYLKH